MLVKHVSLDNPEAVKTFVPNQKSWSNAYKENIANAYTHRKTMWTVVGETDLQEI